MLTASFIRVETIAWKNNRFIENCPQFVLVNN